MRFRRPLNRFRMSQTVIIGAVVACTTGAVAHGQSREVPTSQDRVPVLGDVEKRLQSGVARDVAWGAFLAAQYRLVGAVSLIAAALQTPAPDQIEKQSMISALLDALVQLDAHLPARDLEEFVGLFPVQTMLLLRSASTNRDDVLLGQLTTASGFRWYVAANTLLETTPPGFAAKVLDKLTLRLTITISEDGRTASGDGSGRSIGDSLGGVGNPEGYPPKATYRFEDGPRSGHIVLSTGPHTVYYSRHIQSGQFGVGGIAIGSIGGPTDAERLDYLKALLELSVRMAVQLKAMDRRSVAWHGAEDLQQQVSRGRDDIRRNYQRLLSLLVQAQRLTWSEASMLMRPIIDVQLVDARQDRSEPLPTISPR